MKYLLDTNVCIKYLNADSVRIVENLKKHMPDDITLCSVVKSELLTGAYKSNVTDKVLKKLNVFFDKFTSLVFDDEAADMYGKIRAELEKAGSAIGPYDMQSASIAIVHNLILITHNINEFSRIKDLKMEDWE
mgnify:CR=1 FL=1